MSLSLHKESSSDYIEDGYQFHPENLSLVILGSKKEHEGWYFMYLEENVHIQSFCAQLKLYGNKGGFPTPPWKPEWSPL